MTSIDEQAQSLWNTYTRYKKKMFELSNSGVAPWQIIDANKKSDARLEAITQILAAIPYQS